MPAHAHRPATRSLGARYLAFTAIVVSSLLLFVVGNLLAWAILATGWLDEKPGALTYDIRLLEAANPGRSSAEIEELVTESWIRPYQYEPFTQFREAPFNGRHVNVRREGFRESGAGQPWPPGRDRPLILAFGGSTTFGYGLADSETIPARLQESLAGLCPDPPEVYNFGRSNYFSSQERILFQQLLSSGITPSAVVFLDGLNEFAYPEDEPKFTHRLSYLMEESRARLLRRWLVGLPLARLAKTLGPRDSPVPDDEDPERLAGEVVARWLRNARMIESVAASFGVGVVFAWQPVPVYDAPAAANPFLAQEGTPLPNAEAMKLGYSRLDRMVGEKNRLLPDAGLVWLAALQRGSEDVLYVDRAHYTAAFSTTVAESLATALASRLCHASD